MKVFDKRIAFVVSKQHLIPHGGIGQFTKSFIEMANNMNCIVDVILDGKPYKSDFVEYIRSISGNMVHPKEEHSGSAHSDTFAFSESFSIEKMLNFRNSLMESFQQNLYDMILINTTEALVPIYGLNIHQKVSVVFYTHNENLIFEKNSFKGVFNDAYSDFFKSLMYLNGVIIGTQSERNRLELSNSGVDARHLGMKIPETGLLDSSDSHKKTGILFIGRWEERKDPKKFIDLIKKTGLPAKVMTNKKGASKFKKALEEINATFDIKYEIIGQEKVDFIKSSKLLYMPSKSESYGFALIECLGHMPCVVDPSYEWHLNFKSNAVYRPGKSELTKVVSDLYQRTDFIGDMHYVIQEQDNIEESWKNLIWAKYDCTNQKETKISGKDNFYYSDHVKSLNRFASIEDVISAINFKNRGRVKYTLSGTWFSKEGVDPPEPDKSYLEEFFSEH